MSWASELTPEERGAITFFKDGMGHECFRKFQLGRTPSTDFKYAASLASFESAIEKAEVKKWLLARDLCAKTIKEALAAGDVGLVAALDSAMEAMFKTLTSVEEFLSIETCEEKRSVLESKYKPKGVLDSLFSVSSVSLGAGGPSLSVGLDGLPALFAPVR